MKNKKYLDAMFELKLQRDILILEMDRLRDKESKLYEEYKDELEVVNGAKKKLEKKYVNERK